MSKAFSEELYGTASLLDKDGRPWILTFDGADYQGASNTTLFSYTLDKPSGGGGTHLAYRLPECADYVVDSAFPPATSNGNANGDLEWGPSDFSDGENTITLEFEGEVDLGLVFWGLKAQGDGGAPQDSVIVGPCQGRYTISGTVFLNDESADLGVTNDTWDPDTEPGIANVEVQLWESYDGGATFTYDASSGIHRTSPSTDFPGDFGSYSFEVLSSPLPNTPTHYKVVIAKTSVDGGINSQLFNGNLFSLACGADCPNTNDPAVTIDAITRDVVGLPPNDVSGINFGFELDVKRAIQAFEDENIATDGLNRNYWYAQAAQWDKKYALDFSADAFTSLLNCSGPAVFDPTPSDEPDFWCIADNPAAPDYPDFGGDVDELIDLAFDIDGTNDRVEAAEILKSANNGDLQERLRTQILAALLNVVSGRGICNSGGLNADGRCANGLDVAAMRLVIQDALIVLKSSNYGASKASSGSVGSSGDLLNSVNGA